MFQQHFEGLQGIWSKILVLFRQRENSKQNEYNHDGKQLYVYHISNASIADILPKDVLWKASLW